MDSVSRHGRSRNRGKRATSSIHRFESNRQGLSLAHIVSGRVAREIGDRNVCATSRTRDRTRGERNAAQDETGARNGQEVKSLCRCRPSSRGAATGDLRTSFPQISKIRQKDLRRGRYSILRNRAAEDFDCSSLFAAGWRRGAGQSKTVRNLFPERNATDDYSAAVEFD